MLSIKDKLRSLDNSARSSPTVDQPQPYNDLARYGLQENSNKFGNYIVREKRFPLSFAHGNSSPADYLQISKKHLKYINKNEFAYDLSPEDFVFFDSETTGLAGGSGTYVFLCGLGYVDQHEFIVKQFLLSAYKNEYAYLFEIKSVLEKFKGLISFNGKSYDIPLLKARFILNKMDLNFENYAHIDLLHSARRLWKKKINECNLGNIEKNILGFVRQNDVSGSGVPALFFNYVKTNNIEYLLPVFKHNSIDILSMVSIINAMDNAFDTSMQIRGSNLADTRGLLQSYMRFDDQDAITTLRHDCLENLETDVLLDIAFHFKKNGQIEEASVLWEQLLLCPKFVETAFLELAKYYEHTESSYSKALDIVRRAIKRLEFKSELGREEDNGSIEDWYHRYHRLMKKCSQNSRN